MVVIMMMIDNTGGLPRRVLVPSVRRGQQRGSQLLRVCAGARCHCLFAKVVLVQMVRNLTSEWRWLFISRIDYEITKWKANNVSDLNTPEDKLNWIFTAFDQVFIQRIIHSELSVLSDFLYLLFEFLHLCLHHFTTIATSFPGRWRQYWCWGD